MLALLSPLAFTLVPLCRPAVPPRAHVFASEAETAVSTRDAAILFGKMSEASLYLDPSIGACCHSACSDCEWRLPDGGYKFDLLKATSRKWLPVYFKRDFADERGCGIPRWAAALFPACVEDGADVTAVTRAEFDAVLASLEFEMPMGPRGKVGAGAEPSAAAVEALWGWLAEGADELAPAAMRARLQAMSADPEDEGAVGEGPDSLAWKEFAKAIGAKPFEMIV